MYVDFLFWEQTTKKKISPGRATIRLSIIGRGHSEAAISAFFTFHRGELRRVMG